MNTLVNKNIITLRKIAGLKPTDIAAFLGIPREVVVQYENGHKDIPINHLEKLADLFRVDLYDLIETNLICMVPQLTSLLKTHKFSTAALKTISRFNRIIKNYLKMKKLNI